VSYFLEVPSRFYRDFVPQQYFPPIIIQKAAFQAAFCIFEPLNSLLMKVTIIGTGNVAYHLGLRFREKDIFLNQIIGRNKDKTRAFSIVLQTDATADFSEIKKDSTLYIIAVNDSAIEDVARNLSQHIDNQLVVHTSGSVPSAVLAPYFKNYGSLYPLQTFSVSSFVDFDNIPFFIHAASTQSSQNTQYLLDYLQKIALTLAPNVYFLPDEKRMSLHVAAVFVNNFTNYLFQIGKDITDKNDLPFDALKPLIEQTILKIQNQEPSTVQTGPAIRGDFSVIQKHLDFLKGYPPQYFELYKLFSESISNSTI
jgi:predicted short-subunit dehydrogenase-like oxidoreductase (DUF2520 family)